LELGVSTATSRCRKYILPAHFARNGFGGIAGLQCFAQEALKWNHSLLRGPAPDKAVFTIASHRAALSPFYERGAHAHFQDLPRAFSKVRSNGELEATARNVFGYGAQLNCPRGEDWECGRTRSSRWSERHRTDSVGG